MRRVLVVGLLMLVGCGGGSVTLHGTLSGKGEYHSPVLGLPASCGYAPVRNKAAITIRDGDGKVIATTTGSETKPAGFPAPPSCVGTETYSVNVPKADFYQVSIQCVSTPADPISYDALKAKDFELDYTITGNDC